MANLDFEVLKEKAKWLRLSYLDMVMNAGQGHIPSGFSMVEILISLYYSGLVKYSSKDPNDEYRDRVIVSKGHAAPVLYPVLADLGYFDTDNLNSFTQENSLLSMYPDPKIPGIECVSGSLGHGIGLASGITVGMGNLKGDKFHTYVILGDGECYEGSVWESAFFAAAKNIESITVIVDANQYCILGSIEECLSQGDLKSKWEAFGWDAHQVNGHSIEELHTTLKNCKKTNKPSVIIANTLKGKGVSFMEGQHLWHNRTPNKQEYEIARTEILNGNIK